MRLCTSIKAFIKTQFGFLGKIFYLQAHYGIFHPPNSFKNYEMYSERTLFSFSVMIALWQSMLTYFLDKHDNHKIFSVYDDDYTTPNRQRQYEGKYEQMINIYLHVCTSMKSMKRWWSRGKYEVSQLGL